MLFVRTDDRQFLLALDEIARTSRRDDPAVLKGQAIQLTRELVKRTRLAVRGRRKGGKFFRIRNKHRRWGMFLFYG